MTTHASVYPSAIADKCIELLCAQQRGHPLSAAHLTAARFLMLHGYVETQGGASEKALQFVVLSPETPRFYYSVDLRSEACTCADFLRTQRPCKHLYAAALAMLAHRRFGCPLPTVPQKTRGQ